MLHQFSTARSTYRRQPVIEVLADGGEWGITFPWDSHFRFGLTKARMIRSAIGFTEEFVRSDGRGLPFGVPIDVFADGAGIPCICTTHPRFVNRWGRNVDLPYMCLRSGATEVGFGVTKADALVSVWREIEAFILEHA